MAAYRTWINSTAPAINADNLNTLQEAVGFVNVKDRSLTDGGANGDGTTDDRAAIQSAIDALPARGGVIYFPAGTYKINASGGVGLNLTNKDSVTFLGELGSSFNEAIGGSGTEIVCGSSSMTLILCEPGSIKQRGPRFKGINFGSDQASCKLVRIVKTNNWSFEDCRFGGNGSGLIGIELDLGTSGDNNWNTLINCKFSWGASVGTSAIAINAIECGMHMYACTFNLNTGMIGLKIGKAQSVHATNCYWTGATSTTGYAIYCEGGSCHFIGCNFENFGGDTTNPSVKIVDGAEPPQGKNNKVIGCHFGSGTVGIEIGASCNNNVCIGNTFSTTTSITDSGSSTTIIHPDEVKLAPWSGSKTSFFGNSPATKQTVTGSKGGNAALASLITALATYGLITDSSS